ncbi:MAG: CinA family protein [Actinobacteria bacterium]|nr:CinA family protein [Actinomycetota bacterium]
MTQRSAGPAHRLVELLTDRGQMIAIAQSLTGGLASLRLTQAEGTGDVFVAGIVCYQSVAKHQLLSAGPVISRQCAAEMAEGAAVRFDSDVAVASTGVADPDAQEHQPVGTVRIAWTIGGLTDAVCLHLPDGDADQVREHAAAAGFDLASVVLEATSEKADAS